MRSRRFLKFFTEKTEHYSPEQHTVRILVLTVDAGEAVRLKALGVAVEHVRWAGGAVALARKYDAAAILAAGLDKTSANQLRAHSPRVIVSPSTAGIQSLQDLVAMVGRAA